MKKVLFAMAALMMMGLSAHANTGDQMTTVMTCGPLVAHPDLGMKLTLTKGGLAGMTMIRIERFFLGHSSVENFIVEQMPQEQFRLGAPLVFQGQDISLTVNYTTAPTPQGGHHGTLQLQQGTSVSTEQLSCR